VNHVEEQSREMERERARRKALAQEDARLVEGHLLGEGIDGGGRRDFLAGLARPRRTDALPPNLRRLACRSVRIELATQGPRAASALTGRPGGGGARPTRSALRLAGTTGSGERSNATLNESAAGTLTSRTVFANWFCRPTSLTNSR
jgi:hypothetical protein